MSNIITAQEQIKTGWRVLQTQWQTTKSLWRDPVQRHFEREFWSAWEREVPATLNAMQHLADVISAARREVK